MRMRRASCRSSTGRHQTRAGVCGRLVSLCRCIRSFRWCIGGRRVRGWLRVLCATFRYMPCGSWFHSRAFTGCSWMGAIYAAFPYPSGAAVYVGSAFAYAGECVGSWWSVLIVGLGCFHCLGAYTSSHSSIPERAILLFVRWGSCSIASSIRSSSSCVSRIVILGYLFIGSSL